MKNKEKEQKVRVFNNDGKLKGGKPIVTTGTTTTTAATTAAGIPPPPADFVQPAAPELPPDAVPSVGP